MTRGEGEDLDNGEIVAAVATAEDGDRAEMMGAVHTSTIADMIGASVDPVGKRCKTLAEDGVLHEQYDKGPTGPRLCYRVADPSTDASDADDDREVRVYV